MGVSGLVIRITYSNIPMGNSRLKVQQRRRLLSYKLFFFTYCQTQSNFWLPTSLFEEQSPPASTDPWIIPSLLAPLYPVTPPPILIGHILTSQVVEGGIQQHQVHTVADVQGPREAVAAEEQTGQRHSTTGAEAPNRQGTCDHDVGSLLRLLHQGFCFM